MEQYHVGAGDAFIFHQEAESRMDKLPVTADKTDHEVAHIWLKPSWCKGGRNRMVPITSETQLDELQATYRLVGRGARSSLIPSNKKYIQQRNRYDYEYRRVGLSGMHGLRHAYAQRRYHDLTGYDAPVLSDKRRATWIRKPVGSSRKNWPMAGWRSSRAMWAKCPKKKSKLKLCLGSC